MSIISTPQPIIDAPAALQAVQAAVEYAHTQNLSVNITIVDRAGLTVAFARMAGAALHSMDIATDKAYTAASFGIPTGQWHKQLENEPPAVREGLARRLRFVAFGGGFPIIEHGKRIGGIGVSGASEQQDETIALAGLHALGLSA